MFFHFLADLTKAMDTPIPGERPAPADLDLARVGLHAPTKSPLQLGASPLERAPPGDVGLFCLALAFSFGLCRCLILIVCFCFRRRLY